jgi:hypothetical protein
VYTEITRQLHEAGFQYVDLTHAFDGRSQVYIDFAHVSPRGNEIIGQSIAEHLR